MRALLVVAGGLVLPPVCSSSCSPWHRSLVAWTIDPPMTAVFLWRLVLVGCGVRVERSTVEVLGWRTGQRADGVRLHHADAVGDPAAPGELPPRREFDLSTRGVTWAWIAICALVPLLMAVVWIRQVRVPGDHPRGLRRCGPRCGQSSSFKRPSSSGRAPGCWSIRSAPATGGPGRSASSPAVRSAPGSSVSASLRCTPPSRTTRCASVRRRGPTSLRGAASRGVGPPWAGARLEHPGAWVFVAVLIAMAVIGVTTLRTPVDAMKRGSTASGSAAKAAVLLDLDGAEN